MAEVEIAGAPAKHLASLLVIGTFYQDLPFTGVNVDWKNQPFIPTEEQAKQIAERWQSRAKKGYFPGPVSRVTGYAVSTGGLKLVMQPTSFKEYVGLQTNEDAGKYGIANLANPLSVSLAIMCVDERWVMAVKRRGDRSGSLDAVGGYVNPQKDVLWPKFVEQIRKRPPLLKIADRSGLLKLLHRGDVWRTAKREYREETGAAADSILAMMVLGLTYEHKDLNHPVLNVLVRSRLTSDQLREAAPRNSDGEVNLLFASSVLETIRQKQREKVDIEPDGQLSFALAQAYWGFHSSKRLIGDWIQKN